jgi:hypothetical protein
MFRSFACQFTRHLPDKHSMVLVAARRIESGAAKAIQNSHFRLRFAQQICQKCLFEILVAIRVAVTKGVNLYSPPHLLSRCCPYREAPTYYNTFRPCGACVKDGDNIAARAIFSTRSRFPGVLASHADMSRCDCCKNSRNLH